EKARRCRDWDASGPAPAARCDSNPTGASAVAECCEASRQVAQVVAQGVKAGRIVEIDGLGVFYPDARRGLRFEPQVLPQVFLAHVREDGSLAARLFSDLE